VTETRALSLCVSPSANCSLPSGFFCCKSNAPSNSIRFARCVARRCCTGFLGRCASRRTVSVCGGSRPAMQRVTRSQRTSQVCAGWVFNADHVLAWEFKPPTPCRSCIAPGLSSCAPVWLLAQVFASTPPSRSHHAVVAQHPQPSSAVSEACGPTGSKFCCAWVDVLFNFKIVDGLLVLLFRRFAFYPAEAHQSERCFAVHDTVRFIVARSCSVCSTILQHFRSCCCVCGHCSCFLKRQVHSDGMPCDSCLCRRWSVGTRHHCRLHRSFSGLSCCKAVKSEGIFALCPKHRCNTPLRVSPRAC
jgi:hypothetical protein